MNAATTLPAPPVKARPPWRWVGGKRQLLPELRKYVPITRDATYYEPFVGGGALFFDLAPKRAVLSDTNQQLIDTYVAIRDDVDLVIDALSDMAGIYRTQDSGYYYEVRNSIASLSGPEAAAKFIFLLAAGFNGLWRTNRAGKYNVPAGKFKTPPTICDEENLRAVSFALRDTLILCIDFELAVRPAVLGDLVYFDPPYWPVTKSANFTGYTADGFGPKDQERLRDCAKILVRRGVHVVLSNADVPEVRALYGDGFTLHEVQARRSVNSATERRGKVGELIIVGDRS